jgi:hypothetical protein
MYIVVWSLGAMMVCKRSTEYLLSTCGGWVVRNTLLGTEEEES